MSEANDKIEQLKAQVLEDQAVIVDKSEQIERLGGAVEALQQQMEVLQEAVDEAHADLDKKEQELEQLKQNGAAAAAAVVASPTAPEAKPEQKETEAAQPKSAEAAKPTPTPTTATATGAAAKSSAVPEAVAAARARRGSKKDKDSEAKKLKKKQQEEERKRKEKEEEERKKKEEEEAERKRKEVEEAERKKKQQEEEERKKKEAEEAERKRKEAEEAERKRKEAEEAERKRKEAEEAERKRKEEEAERKRKEAEEAERKRQEEEAERKRKEEEEEAERKRKEAEEAEMKRREEEEEAQHDRSGASLSPVLELPPPDVDPDRYWRCLFDYDPFVQSPNEFGTDDELRMQAGDIIGTFGEMDQDGFFMAQNPAGERGLVPSNFLELLGTDEAAYHATAALLARDKNGAAQPQAQQQQQQQQEKKGEEEQQDDGAALLPPTDLSLNDLKSDEAVVEWRLPLKLDPIDHYVVEMNGRQVAEIVDPTCTTAQIEETYEPGQTYAVQVYSVGYEGERSEPSQPLTFICPTEPTDEAAADNKVESEATGGTDGNVVNGKSESEVGDDDVRLFAVLYDYDPETMSPNDEFDEELPLKEGMVIKVIGPVADDGFYEAEHNGRRGLVPSNFVEELSPETVSEFTDVSCVCVLCVCCVCVV